MVSGHSCSIINLGTQKTDLISSIVGKTVYSVSFFCIYKGTLLKKTACLAESLEFM